MKRRTKNRKEDLKKGYLSLLLRATGIAAAALVLFGVFWMLWPVQGQDMFPAARDGDLLLASRVKRVWRRGDIVVYQTEGQRRVGRIAAQGNDLVDITEDGTLMINHALQSEASIDPMPPDRGDFPFRVPEGCVYILGDNRTAGRDSRDFGPISTRAVVGKVIGLFRIRGF